MSGTECKHMSALPSSQESPLTRSPWIPRAACLVGLAAYWFPFIHIVGSCGVGQYANVARYLIMFLLGMAGGVLLWKKVSSYGVMGFMGAWGIDVALSLSLPAIFHCSHQLLPFEGIMVYAMTFGLSWLGFFVGKLLARFLDTSLRPGNWRTLAYGLICLGGVMASLSFTLLPLELRTKEKNALESVKRLVQGQHAFRASHPQTGFSCELSELSSAFSTTWPSSERNKNYEYAVKDGYTYRLWCSQDAPRVKYNLEAFPTCVPTCGNTGYCVNESGMIKSLSRDKIASGKDWSKLCWDSGATVDSALP